MVYPTLSHTVSLPTSPVDDRSLATGGGASDPEIHKGVIRGPLGREPSDPNPPRI